MQNYDRIENLELKNIDITDAELGFINKFSLEKTSIRIVECNYSKEVLQSLRKKTNVKIIVKQLLCENIIEIEDDNKE